VGLREDTAITNGVPIATAGTIADENLVGFHALEGDGDQFDTIYKANGVTQVTVKADAITLVADTYVKLGMHYNDRNRILTFFKDGVALDDTKTIPSAAGTDFPNDVDLCMTFVTMMAAGSTPGYPVIDWWGCAQAIV